MCQGCCVQVRESIYQVSCCIGYLDNIKYILRHTWYSKLCNRWYGYNIIYIHSLFDTQYTMHIYIYIYIKCIFHFTGICSVLEGWLITVLMMFNVFLYGQSPNPQYGGSGGDGDHVYRHMQCIYIYIFMAQCLVVPPAPPEMVIVPICIWILYIYIYIIYIYIYLFIYFFIYTHVFVSIRM